MHVGSEKVPRGPNASYSYQVDEIVIEQDAHCTSSSQKELWLAGGSLERIDQHRREKKQGLEITSVEEEKNEA